MAHSTARSSLTVALVGNPNTGKSTLFTALAGVRQRVGNYPGVTVEKKIASVTLGGHACQIVDLPGTYSLAPRSPDEMVAVDVLLGRQSDVGPVDVVVSIVDASNLERNLYLVSQVLELGLPTVVALNMVDIARDKGLSIDVERLRRQLGVPVVELQANRRRGIGELTGALAALFPADAIVAARESPFPPEFQREVDQLQRSIASTGLSSVAASRPLPRYLVERLLLDTSGYLNGVLSINGQVVPLRDDLAAARARLAAAGLSVPAVEAQARYAWVGRVLSGVVSHPPTRRVTRGDKLDRFLTHKVWGTFVFAMAMLVVFSSVFLAADPLMRGIDGAGRLAGRAVGRGAWARGHCGRSWSTAWWVASAACWCSCRRFSSCFSSWRFSKTAATWPAPRI